MNQSERREAAMTRPRNETTTCTVCGGRAFRRRELLAPYGSTGPWLHLRQEDWQDNPHNVVPA